MPSQTNVSYEAYMAWARQQEGRSEWVNGRIIQHMSVSAVHQQTVQFLLTLISLYLEIYALGKLLTGPAEAKLSLTISREPDLFFISNEQLPQLTDERFAGAPALVVEVVSRTSIKRDRDTKWKEYQRLGVQEYWVIDPRTGSQRADFYQLDANGEYTLVATESDNRYESQVLSGFWLNPAWLWQINSLKTTKLLAEITGLSSAELAAKLF